MEWLPRAAALGPCREHKVRWGGSRGIGLVVGAALASLTFPVLLQFFAFLTTLLYILHAFSIYYH